MYMLYIYIYVIYIWICENKQYPNFRVVIPKKNVIAANELASFTIPAMTGFLPDWWRSHSNHARHAPPWVDAPQQKSGTRSRRAGDVPIGRMMHHWL